MCGGSEPWVVVVCQEGVPVAGDPRFVELPLLAFVSSSFSLGLMFYLPQRSLYRCWLLCITKRGTLFRYKKKYLRYNFSGSTNTKKICSCACFITISQ